ncbi:MAG: polysaccharide deacetylase family protein [Pseudomonadota bacterium]
MLRKEVVVLGQTAKKSTKQLLGRLGRRAGLLSRLYRGKTLILTYHRITGPGESACLEPGMYVEAATFARHIRFLTRHFSVIPLAGFLARPAHSAPRCVITFDDGWLDNHTHALPLLRQAGLPATVFLAEDYFLGVSEWLWSDRAAWLAARSWPAALGLWIPLTGADLEFQRGRAEFVASLVAYLKGLDDDAREAVLSLAGQRLGAAGVLPRERRFLNRQEIAQMASQGITFGCHTRSHRDLTRLDPADAAAELRGPLKTMSDVPGFLPVLSYPYGSWNPVVAAEAGAAGYQAALTMTAGANGPRTDRFALRRVGLHQDVSASDDLLAFRLLRAALGAA